MNEVRDPKFKVLQFALLTSFQPEDDELLFNNESDGVSVKTAMIADL
jgi:hypothetical protein